MTLNALYDIRLYNRRNGQMEIEQVYGRRFMDLFYGTAWGRAIENRWLCRRTLSQLYGRLQQHPLSRRQIAPFIAQYGIDMDEAIVPVDGFRSFNDFFIRRLKPGARPVDERPERLVAPADSRLQIFTIDPDTTLSIKGTVMTLPQLLGFNRMEDGFQGGLCLSFRLAPCDYHRFGYADHGVQGPVHTIGGPLHSVSPLALRHRADILATNYRQWCFVQSRHFGTLIQVEVGAMMVGSVVQQQPHGGPCRRGREKGYFQFGGSTVILIVGPDQVIMDDDIVAYSRKGIETRVSYGEAVGRILRS